MSQGSGHRPYPARALAVACAGVLAAVAGTAAAAPSSAASPAPKARPAPVPASYVFSGGGWGHGVGMSQYGALGMAKEGYSAAQILQHYYSGTTVAAAADSAPIRVNIGHRWSVVRFRAAALADGGGTLEYRLPGQAPVVVSPPAVVSVLSRKGRVLVRVAATKGKPVGVGSAPIVEIRWAGTTDPGTAGAAATALDVAGPGQTFSAQRRYRYGSVDIATVSGFLEVVNRVPVSEYLYGISEVPASWPAPALQAQAIAARSYALAHLATTRANCRCNVDNGSGGYSDQTYVGYGRETGYQGSRWKAAVTATQASASAGLAVLYAGSPISAFYFSSSGGRTQNSEDVWGGYLPWARSVDDHWASDPKYNNSGFANWSRTKTGSEVAAAFGLPDVARIDLSNRYVSGAVRKATGYSASGQASTISGSSFVARLGLTSAWVRSATPR